MACDFKIGDEVVCVDASLAWGIEPHSLIKGETYTVVGLVDPEGFDPGVVVQVPSPHYSTAWSPRRFRKVQKRNDRLTLETFFTVPGGFEEPKRTPAKRRERA